VPRNALVLTGLVILRVVDDAETARALVISSASGKTTPVDLMFARLWDPLRQRDVGPPWSVPVIIQRCNGASFEGMQCPINPLVLLATLHQNRIRGGSRRMDWPP
jgi:hypothetical protein